VATIFYFRQPQLNRKLFFMLAYGLKTSECLRGNHYKADTFGDAVPLSTM